MEMEIEQGQGQHNLGLQDNYENPNCISQNQYNAYVCLCVYMCACINMWREGGGRREGDIARNIPTQLQRLMIHETWWHSCILKASRLKTEEEPMWTIKFELSRNSLQWSQVEEKLSFIFVLCKTLTDNTKPMEVNEGNSILLKLPI